MKFKIQNNEKIPLTIRKKENSIKFQCQHEVAAKDGSFLGVCVDFFAMEYNNSVEEIGKKVSVLLNKFHEYADFTKEDVYNLKHMAWEEYEKIRGQEIRTYFGVKDSKEMMTEYQVCTIDYNIAQKRYYFVCHWFNKRQKCFESSGSTGKPGLLTFDTPLEFDSSISPEALGRMTLEAFDRCQQLRDAAAGNKFPKKQLTLLDETMLEVQMPRDKHFSDSEDMGAGELYQVYEYFPKEDSEDAQAHFFLGIGAELDCDLSEEHILAAWEKYHGKAEFFEIQEVKHGIYSLRAELRNKNVHKVSYFMPQNETLL